MTKMIYLLAAACFTVSPVYAGHAWCPIDRQFYDTNTGYIFRGDRAIPQRRLLLDPNPPGVGDRLDIDWSQWKP